MRDYYDILGVRPDAALEEIKRAYKELARRDHPDRNPGSSTAEEAFKELSGAYAVLSDPKTRVLYDVYGPTAFQESRLHRPRPRGGIGTATVEAPALYLRVAEMAHGCAKVLPAPCAACAGRARDIAGACPVCGGRGWEPRGPRVRIDVPAGVSPGDTLWGQTLADDSADPIPFTVRLRRDPRAPTTPGASTASGGPRAEAPATPRGGTPAGRHGQTSGPPLSFSLPGSGDSGPGILVRGLRRVRERTDVTAERLAQRARKSVRTLSETPPYPIAVQLAAVARSLDGVGERQILVLDQVARRFAADVTRLGQLLPADPARPPETGRVAEVVSQSWGALRLAVYSLVGALVLGTLAAWLIASTIGDLGPSATLLPGPLAVVSRGPVVGVVFVCLTVLAGMARRLLVDVKSEDVGGFVVESVPTMLLVAVGVLTGSLFWRAAPGWLHRLGLASADADILPRAGIVAAGGLLMLCLFALGDWCMLGMERDARARTRLRAAGLLADRERRLERARTLAARIKEEAQALRAGTADLPADVRRDFAQAVGIQAGRSVAESVGEAVHDLLDPDASKPPAIPLRQRGSLIRFAADLLAFALWATGLLLVFASLGPAIPAWAAGNPVLVALAALALPLAASLGGMLAKEGMRRASQAELSHRSVPWLGQPATLAVAILTVIVLATIAGWAQASHVATSGNAAFAGVWEGALVVAVAAAALHLDASLLAAFRLAMLTALGLAWMSLRAAGACARTAETALVLVLGEYPEAAPASDRQEQHRQRA